MKKIADIFIKDAIEIRHHLHQIPELKYTIHIMLIIS